MTQEELNNEVQIRLAVQDEKFNSMLARIDATNQRVDNFISEMRDRDNQRHAENEELRQMIEAKNAEMRQSIKEIYTTTDEKVARIEAKVDSTNKYISNFFYTSLAAIGAMLVTVLLNLPKG